MTITTPFLEVVINDLEVYTPKVIAIAVFRYAIYHFLLVACCYHVLSRTVL